MNTFNSDVLDRIGVAVDLANAHVDQSLPGAVGSRPTWIFETRNYLPPDSGTEWEQVAVLAERLDAVLHRIAAGDHEAAIAEVNTTLERLGVTPYIEQTEGGCRLHFHTPAASFADGWSGGIHTALASSYGEDQVSRIGRCSRISCDRLYLDRGRNQQRCYCSLKCQNREKSAAYRRQRTRA